MCASPSQVVLLDPFLQCRRFRDTGDQISVERSAVFPCVHHHASGFGGGFAKTFEHPLHGRLIRPLWLTMKNVNQHLLVPSLVVGDECFYGAAGE